MPTAKTSNGFEDGGFDDAGFANAGGFGDGESGDNDGFGDAAVADVGSAGMPGSAEMTALVTILSLVEMMVVALVVVKVALVLTMAVSVLTMAPALALTVSVLTTAALALTTVASALMMAGVVAQTMVGAGEDQFGADEGFGEEFGQNEAFGGAATSATPPEDHKPSANNDQSVWTEPDVSMAVDAPTADTLGTISAEGNGGPGADTALGGNPDESTLWGAGFGVGESAPPIGTMKLSILISQPIAPISAAASLPLLLLPPVSPIHSTPPGILTSASKVQLRRRTNQTR